MDAKKIELTSPIHVVDFKNVNQLFNLFNNNFGGGYILVNIDFIVMHDRVA